MAMATDAQDIAGVPVQLGGRPQRGHPYKVHCGDARAHHGAAEHGSREQVRDKTSRARRLLRGHDRKCGQTGIVAYPKPGS